MPQAQDQKRLARDFIAKLVVAHKDPPDFARRKSFEPLADPRVTYQPIRRARQLPYDASRRPGRDRPQMFIKSREI